MKLKTKLLVWLGDLLGVIAIILVIITFPIWLPIELIRNYIKKKRRKNK